MFLSLFVCAAVFSATGNETNTTVLNANIATTIYKQSDASHASHLDSSFDTNKNFSKYFEEWVLLKIITKDETVTKKLITQRE